MHEEDITIQHAYEEMTVIFRWMYFDHMVLEPKPNFKKFKRQHLKVAAKLLDKIHDTYSDHAEARHNEYWQ